MRPTTPHPAFEVGPAFVARSSATDFDEKGPASALIIAPPDGVETPAQRSARLLSSWREQQAALRNLW